MAIFDDIVEKTRQAGKFVCEKAEDAKDYVTLEYKASKLKSDIDAQYKALGKLIYDLSETESEECADTQVYIDSITVLKKELDAVTEEMSKFKNICPSCKVTNAQNAAFCNKCGTALK